MSNWDTKFLKKVTLDDVLLIPAESHAPTKQSVNLASNIKILTLNIPLSLQPWIRITDSKMAISIARAGGRHSQKHVYYGTSEEVRAKRSENGVTIDPFFLTPENKVCEAEELMQRYSYLRGLRLLRHLENRKLVGIITNRDMRFISNYDTPISGNT